ncbi:hypothetical protein [Halococcus sp. IIIV-5B]|uniref:hypothetical protein n=1 Tax=Halococcus sp. IIIV-5B TaxID=2321230 RepID=UPI0011C42410|nr:hypothetical protein [Halococcus sp. IIIV-5B]
MSEEESEDPQRETEQLSEQSLNHRENAEQRDLDAKVEKGERSDLSERVEEGELSIEDIPGGYVPRNVRARAREEEEATRESENDDE